MKLRWGSERERLLSMVKRGGPDDCWPWLGGANEWGYGIVRYNGRNTIASRALYQEMNSVKLAPHEFVLHSCDNPICVNLAHLRVGTHKENCADQVARGRRPVGDKIFTTKLTPDDVREIRALGQAMGSRRIAKIFNISRNNTIAILKRRTWRYVE